MSATCVMLFLFMGYWTKPETEIIINLQGREPAQANVYTNWPRFASRLSSCEGFSPASTWQAPGGGEELIGSISLSPYRYLYLRRSLGESSRPDFEERKSELPEPRVFDTDFRLGTGERETVLQACLDDPYWLTISSDMTWWLKRLEDNPWAVMLEEQHYAGSDDGGIEYMRSYAVPLKLLQIRRRRPRLSEEERRARSERLSKS